MAGLAEVERTLLQVSAQERDRASLRNILAPANWLVTVESTWQEAMELLRKKPVAVVIADAEREAANWRRLLADSSELPQAPCVIISSRLADERLWAEVLNLGAYDLLCTPFVAEEVQRVTLLAFQFWQRERELTRKQSTSAAAAGRYHTTTPPEKVERAGARGPFRVSSAPPTPDLLAPSADRR